MDMSKIVLNRQERKLLRKINFLTGNGKMRIVKSSVLTGQPEFNQYYFDQLHKLGLVETHHYPGSEKTDKVYLTDNGFYSTPDGLHYFDWHWEHFRQFMYKSVIVPAFVSFFVTVMSAFVVAEIHHFFTGQ